jgi:hypothetical protein
MSLRLNNYVIGRLLNRINFDSDIYFLLKGSKHCYCKEEYKSSGIFGSIAGTNTPNSYTK